MGKAKSKRKVAPTPSTALATPEIVEVKAGIFKNTCLELMDEVRDQLKQIVITKYGQVVAKLVPPDAVETPSAFGFLRGTLLAHGDIVSPDFDAWGDEE